MFGEGGYRNPKHKTPFKSVALATLMSIGVALGQRNSVQAESIKPVPTLNYQNSGDLEAKKAPEKPYPKFFYYNVTSKNSLPNTYPIGENLLPVGVKIVNYSSSPKGYENGRDVPIAELIKQPLGDLVDSAVASGYKPRVQTGFRSFKTQSGQFEKWVNQEMASGKTRAEAEEAASKYSARPGFSEHHLGVAVDLIDTKYNDANGNHDYDASKQHFDDGFYAWVRENAHLYGFVISYSTDTEQEDSSFAKSKEGSGYDAAEPWHLRYMGVSFATQLYDAGYLEPGNSITLATVLEQYHPTGK